MANTLITSSIVAKEVLAILENTCSFSQYVNRDWEDEFTGNMSRGYEPGTTINIKRPSRYTYRAGRVAVPQASVDTTVPLTLSQGGCDLSFTAAERTLSISSEHVQNKLASAVATVTSEIDRQGLAVAKFATYNLLNPAGALPATQLAATQVLADVNTRLDIMSAPVKDGNRAFVMGPVLNGALVPGFAGLFNQSEKIGGQYRTGYMQDSFGLHPLMDQAVATHTNGAATATNINGANQTGSAITVVAVATGTLTRGTVIQLPGVNSVNAQTREDTGIAADFVVTADALVGATTINISPAIVTSGPYQNVTASPTTGSPYVIRGSASVAYKTNIGFHKDAFTLAMVPMWKPMDGMGARVSQKTHKGFTIKVTDFYDGVNDNGVMRLDVLFGWAATYPELATKFYTTS
jgi:hypothetical protein